METAEEQKPALCWRPGSLRWVTRYGLHTSLTLKDPVFERAQRPSRTNKPADREAGTPHPRRDAPAAERHSRAVPVNRSLRYHSIRIYKRTEIRTCRDCHKQQTKICSYSTGFTASFVNWCFLPGPRLELSNIWFDLQRCGCVLVF